MDARSIRSHTEQIAARRLCISIVVRMVALAAAQMPMFVNHDIK